MTGLYAEIGQERHLRLLEEKFERGSDGNYRQYEIQHEVRLHRLEIAQVMQTAVHH